MKWTMLILTMMVMKDEKGEGVQMAEREAISVSIPELLVCIVSGPASRNGSKGS